MDWLRDLPWQVFWFGWGMVALLALGPLAATFVSLRNARAIASQKAVDVADLSEGYRLAWGRTLGPKISAPLTGRPCVWWKAEVWQAQRENVPNDSTRMRWVWRSILDRESDRVVLFGDATVRAAVDATNAMVVPSAWSDWKGRDLPPEDREPDANRGSLPATAPSLDVHGSSGPRYRYREQIIEEDAPMFALGGVEAMEAALRARREAFEDEEDEYGDIDEDDDDPEPEDEGHSFEKYTEPEDLLAISPTPDPVIDEDMGQASWLISRLAGKPFILSTLHPDELAAEQDLAVKGGAIMAAIFGGLALLGAWVRLFG